MDQSTSVVRRNGRRRRETAWMARCRDVLQRFQLCGNMEQALNLLHAALVDGLAAHVAAVCLIQPTTGRAEVMRDSGRLAPLIQVLLAAGVGQAWYREASQTGQTVPIHESPMFAEWKPLFDEFRLGHVFLVPLMAGGRTYGCVVCGWHTAPAPDRIAWLETLCAAFAGHFWAMQEAMRADTTRLQSLAALGVALESRDGETFGHTQRVVRWMRRFMKAAGVTESDRESGVVGAYLHDIGKISVPDHILRKPGPLSPEERKLMERHTVYGYELARRLTFVDAPALDVILYHHERWDGTGYPARLAGPRIPLLARMFAIVDVYDALIHERPYKAAWTPSEAIAYLQAMRGRQFDPELTDLYLSLLKNRRVTG